MTGDHVANNKTYSEFCCHYGMQPTRNNRGLTHANGAIKGAHGRQRRRLIDALALRGSTDSDDLASYQRFNQDAVNQANRRRRKSVEIELAALRPLLVRRSLTVTANQPFSEWNNTFPDEAMTVAAIDRPSLLMLTGNRNCR